MLSRASRQRCRNPTPPGSVGVPARTSREHMCCAHQPGLFLRAFGPHAAAWLPHSKTRAAAASPGPHSQSLTRSAFPLPTSAQTPASVADTPPNTPCEAPPPCGASTAAHGPNAPSTTLPKPPPYSLCLPTAQPQLPRRLPPALQPLRDHLQLHELCPLLPTHRDHLPHASIPSSGTELGATSKESRSGHDRRVTTLISPTGVGAFVVWTGTRVAVLDTACASEFEWNGQRWAPFCRGLSSWRGLAARSGSFHQGLRREARKRGGWTTTTSSTLLRGTFVPGIGWKCRPGKVAHSGLPFSAAATARGNIDVLGVCRRSLRGILRHFAACTLACIGCLVMWKPPALLRSMWASRWIPFGRRSLRRTPPRRVGGQ
ncbi:hypothetical protein HRbin30_02642 [bacterium HR30]|nr:hypothetical protein HRbin30_02642 [bacterium HR30]